MSSSTSSLVQVKKTRQSTINPDQKMFDRLRTKLETLQVTEKHRIKELDEALRFYHAKISLEEQKFLHALIQRTKIVYEFHKTKNGFSKSDRKVLKQMILDDIDMIFQLGSVQEVPVEIQEIFKNLSGKDYHEIVSNDFDEMKSEIEEMCKSQGIDLNLAGLNSTDREEEIMAKLFQSLGTAMNEKEEQFPQRQKTKKQLDKELIREKAEEIQKRSINSIYKQLVRTLHPDLETDIEKKSHKETFMKRLTVAYENKDLYTLLAIEAEWINSTNDIAKTQSQEQLKIYNAILKEQVDAFHQRIETLLLHPKYMPIQGFYGNQFTGIAVLHITHGKMRQSVMHLQSLIQRLQTSEAINILRTTIREEYYF